MFDSINYDHYFRVDEWSEIEVVVLFGVKDVDEFISLMNTSIGAGKLKITRMRTMGGLHDEWDGYCFEPKVIVAWAISKKIELPTKILEWYNSSHKMNKNNSIPKESKFINNF